MLLRDLHVGERARVLGFAEGGGAYRRKLLSMGFTPGAEISITRVAPMGDPVEIRVRGFALSLRRDEADALSVELL
ncbi:FeoA family protein [Azotobacter chroococcum]|uniref:FeoA family protein n=1 Tax=Azotobacter chroococcum TaxID=353 RepID=UPI000B60D6A9|nr:FeoA family protein [Azotobacter chroococcum]ASL26324.1 iron transporter FeoA [Azotobacter chroococcum]